jgi:hypothetical protein
MSKREELGAPIVIVEEPIDPGELSRLVRMFFGNMVKIVVDVRRELLRWRDLIGALYVAAAPSTEDHRAAFRYLLQLNPTASRQIEYLLS